MVLGAAGPMEGALLMGVWDTRARSRALVSEYSTVICGRALYADFGDFIFFRKTSSDVRGLFCVNLR